MVLRLEMDRAQVAVAESAVAERTHTGIAALWEVA